ncbi:MAG: hypothetical protein JOY54_13290 [Acidobacteriaceae bacterium]|nr:hypothetical protein [Acidobacteriaceae bacterium]
MGFLDNLENSLKSLESREERDPAEQKRREEDRAKVAAAAPWAEKLRTSDYTRKLFDEAAIAGHKIRTKVYMSWFESTLRLEARGRRLELRPTPDGIMADLVEPDGETRSERVDLDGEPRTLLEKWLAPRDSSAKEG